MTRNCLLIFLLLGAGAFIAADPSLPDPPQPPWIKDAPVYAKWTITYSSSMGGPASSSAQGKGVTIYRKLRKIEIIKMDKNRHETDIWSDGKTSERWFYGKMILVTQPDTDDVYIFDRSKTDNPLLRMFSDYSTGDFPEIGWLGLDSYVGIKPLGAHQCYVFRSKKMSAPKVEAWIDGEKGLPVMTDDGKTRQTYLFEDLPASTMQLPDRFAESLQRYERAAAAPFAH